jgi:hypothetical protein
MRTYCLSHRKRSFKNKISLFLESAKKNHSQEGEGAMKPMTPSTT